MSRSISLEVDRHWLFAIGGALWTAVGILLLSYAVAWLAPVNVPLELALGGLGIVLAFVAARFIFRGIASKNIRRIDAGPERASVFAFQPWTSYVVMFSMMALGIVLRRSGVPKPALAVVYAGIGGALMLGGGLYHRRLRRGAPSEGGT
jgi:hypothetical protein